MYVNKIIGASGKINFKSVQHTVNSVGKTVELFGYPYDYNTEIAEIELVRAKKDERYNTIINDPSRTINLDDENENIYVIDDSTRIVKRLTPGGVEIDPFEVLNLKEGDRYAFKIRIRDKANPSIIKWEGADTGVAVKRSDKGDYLFKTSGGWEKCDWTLMTTHGTRPMSNGTGYLVMADSLMPGAQIRGFEHPDTGKVYMDDAKQQNAENTLRTFSNIMGGNIAGLISIIPYLKANGYEMLFSLPIANGDDVSSHSYWNKNNNQLAPRMGNLEDYNYFMTELYKNGIQFVNDGTFTSEGLEGIHFQYALRWAQKNPQSYYWFRMNGLKNSNLGLGVIPENAKNLSHRIVNAPYNYEKQADGTYKKVPNLKYNPNKETLFQIYDASQVTESQKNALDKQIRIYENLHSGKPTDINTHDDTLIAYAFQINPNEYQDRINTINKLIKSGKVIDLYGEDGTVLAGQFSNFKIDRKTEGGFVAWDANTDMVKMNYGISAYDLKNLKSIKDRAERYHEQQMIERGACEVSDMTIQSGKYWTGSVRKAQTLYGASIIGKNKTPEALNKLFESGLLPQAGKLTEEEINNVLNKHYVQDMPKGILPKDDVTVRALMNMPLDSIEFGENVQGVLSTSYFSNRATTKETIGKTRFELLKANNPHLVGEYASLYNGMNSIYTHELKDFADKVIQKVNADSETKLLNNDGSYTEYGEYVVEMAADNIVRYALLKSLAGSHFKTKLRFDNQLAYNLDEIREYTTLKALGINASNPKEEAEKLQKIMRNGLKKLDNNDVENLAKSISLRTANTDEMSFRLSEAIKNKAAKGLAWRLDAAKDMKDQDAIRNRENSFDDIWDDMVNFWEQFVQGVKSENPSAYIVAEVTDIPDMMRFTYGAKSCPYDGNTDVRNCKYNGDVDTQIKFFNETGITTEACYSYLFTNMLTNFAPDFEKGSEISPNHDGFKNRVDSLIQGRSADYLRNYFTFIGNHDKTRTIQGLAIDMGLFQSPISYKYAENGEIIFDDQREQREKVIRVLSGVTDAKDVPIELRLNVDNMDYFRTISPKAAAQAQVLMLPVQQDLKGILSQSEIDLITKSIVDLANGNYLINKDTQQMTRIDIPELATLEKVISEILKMANENGLKLDDKTTRYLVKSILEQANTLDFSQYQVHGDFNWSSPNEKIAAQNRQYLAEILGTDNDGSNYSLYTLQLARLVRDAYNKTKNNKYASPAFDKALKDFVNKYNRSYVESRTSEPVKSESVDITRNKDSFGVKPFENVMEWVINQAEFKSGKKFGNRKQIIDRVVTSVTEPAIQKQAMIMRFLNGLFGVDTIFAGDEYGASGYENKTKNTYLPRNTVLRNGVNAERYSKYTTDATRAKSLPDLHPLKDGTPYIMDVMVNGRNRDDVYKRLGEIDTILKDSKTDARTAVKLKAERSRLCKDLAKISYMMYSSNGDAVVSVFYAGDVNHSNRHDYFAEYGLDTEAKRKRFFEENNIDSINPYNRYVPIQRKAEMDAILLGAGVSLPIGTVFVNANARDKTQYVVKDIKGKLGIVRKDGKKIVMDGLTAKNGVMLLKKIRNVMFRGNSYNTQYNIVSNLYEAKDLPTDGAKLSVLAK